MYFFHYSHAGLLMQLPRVCPLAVPSPSLKAGRELCELQEHHTPSRDALWRSQGAGTAVPCVIRMDSPCHRDTRTDEQTRTRVERGKDYPLQRVQLHAATMKPHGFDVGLQNNLFVPSRQKEKSRTLRFNSSHILPTQKDAFCIIGHISKCRLSFHMFILRWRVCPFACLCETKKIPLRYNHRKNILRY